MLKATQLLRLSASTDSVPAFIVEFGIWLEPGSLWESSENLPSEHCGISTGQVTVLDKTRFAKHRDWRALRWSGTTSAQSGTLCDVRPMRQWFASKA